MEGSKNILSGFAHYLADRGVLDKQIALNALEQSMLNKVSYIEYLSKQKLANESSLAHAASDYYGFPLFDVSVFKVELIPLEYFNIQLVKKRLALPLFKKGGLLYVAVSDPTIENLYELRFLTGHDIRFFIAEVSKLSQLIGELQNTAMMSAIDTQEGERDRSVALTSTPEAADSSDYDVDSAPVVNYLNKVIRDAIDAKASDIHFERYESSYRIRYRQHGILVPISSPPPIKLASYLLARIKVISNLDITEHRIPQDGRFKMTTSQKNGIDFRVSVCPTLFGEKIVLRVLDPSSVVGGVEKIGMNTSQQKYLLDGLNRSQGMILVTGPTGSGKTVTLYSSLNFLNSVEKNISTVEDPVEIPMGGVNQVHVNTKVGLTFATALRAFLRQDPDVIMVGEIRDLETAEVAVKASQTGHLVLSTLHTNSASETITRLMNMGVAPYNLAASLSIVVAQRLVRVLCNKCKIEESFPEEVLIAEGFKKEELSKLRLYGAASCDKCTHGYSGRVGIFEVLPISEEIAYAIMQGKNSRDIENIAIKQGFITLRESGLQKIREGVTSLLELNRVFR